MPTFCWIHPADGEWRAYVDGEVAPARRADLDRHLARCATCRRTLSAMEADAAFAARHLGALLNTACAAPVPPMPDRFAPQPERRLVMPVNRRITRLIAAAACLALTLTLFAVPQVRAAALNWVTIFRVQESRVLHFTPKDWESLMQKENPNLEASPLARAMENLIHVETVRSPIHTAGLTLDDLLVQGMARPTHIPEGFTPRDGGTVSTGERLIRVNVKEVNRILAQFGRPERLPDALEGQVVRVAHGAAKRMTYTNNGELLILSEMSMPEVSASGRVDINQVIQVLSGILGNEFGISGALQSQLAQFDMSKTVPLPLVEGKGTEVKVKSWKATYLEDQGWGAVVWMAEGVVRMVEGKLPKDELLRIATGWGD